MKLQTTPIHIYVYIYIYIDRERREKDFLIGKCTHYQTKINAHRINNFHFPCGIEL